MTPVTKECKCFNVDFFYYVRFSPYCSANYKSNLKDPLTVVFGYYHGKIPFTLLELIHSQELKCWLTLQAKAF